MNEATPGTEPSTPSKAELLDALRAEMLTQQDMIYAIVGGIAAAIVGAVFWAFVTVATKYQIGYMAIAVGLMVGLSVRYFGGGINAFFGFIGAFFALLGCALGNLLSQVGFIADAESLGYFETIGFLNFDRIVNIFSESFSPMDILFYGIAAYEGFRFAFRNVEVELELALSAGRVAPLPFAKYRLPVVIVLFIGLSSVVYLVGKGTTGIQTFNYESGKKKSMGELAHGREIGVWETWWENGNKQSHGIYNDGNPDSIWTYYDEDGKLSRTGSFFSGLQHGLWTEYYPGGVVSGTGLYKLGRLDGPWTFYYENGKISSTGSFIVDLANGPWETFYENGITSTKGSYHYGILTGLWNSWYEDGKKYEESDYGEEGEKKILNTWTYEGVPEIVNGNGLVKVNYAGGGLESSGSYKNGVKSGIWKWNYEDGSKQEENEFKEGMNYVINSWSRDGNPLVEDGEGVYTYRLTDGSVSETGTIQKGLRTGAWTTYYPASDTSILSESNYKFGKLDGRLAEYFENGSIKVEGLMMNDKREGEWKWYRADGTVESVVSFVQGKKEGEQLIYYSNGDLSRTEIYKNGELVKSRVGK